MGNENVGIGEVTVVPNAKAFGTALQAQVGTQLQATGAKLSAGLTAATLGFAAAGAAAIAFGKASVEAFEDNQLAVAQLQHALENAPQIINKSTAAYEQQADALQKLTGFQDEEILRADVILTRFGATAEQIRKLNPLVLDYARATGTDATQAAQNIGRALIGNSRALKTIGIAFTATGDRAADLTNLMGLLDEKVGGAAQAFGETFAGQQAKLAAAFDELKEAIGAGIVPVLNALVPVLTKVVEAITAIPAPIRTAAIGFGALIGLLKLGSLWVGFLAKSFVGLTGAQTVNTAATVAEAESLTLYVANAQGAVVATRELAAAQATAAGTAGVGGLAAAIGPLGLALGGVIGFMELVSIRTREATKAIADAKVVLADHTSTTQEAAAAARTLGVEEHGIGTRLPVTAERTKALKEEVDKLRGAQDQTAQSTSDYTGAVQENTDALFTHAQLLEDAAGKYHLIGDASNKVLGQSIQDFHKWERESIDSLTGVEGALQDLAGQSKVTSKEVLKSFTQQVTAQEHYKKNFDAILARGAPRELLLQLQAMGLEGKKVVQALANANDQQFDKIISKWVHSQGIAKDTADDIEGVGRAVKVLPNGKVITVTANTAAALRALTLVENKVRNLRSAGLGTQPIFSASGFHGTVTQPTMFIAGEAGRERVDITPSTGSSAPKGTQGGGAPVVNIYGDVYGLEDFYDKVGQGVAQVFARAAR